MAVDWSEVRARPGDHVCPEHGVVDPWPQVVPACCDCGRAVHLAVATKAGIVFQEPMPRTCAGPDRHRLGPRTVLLGTAACSCSASGIHRLWRCVACDDVQMWPEHSDLDAAPYFGPGSG